MWRTIPVVLLMMALSIAHGADVAFNVSVLPGLRYDPARFAVAPGDRVTVVFHNGDDMIHNLVFVRPGARLMIVQAALALGADGPARNFVPDLPEVIQSTRALNPGETVALTFTAPAAEGVYPYVCTFPGHGFVMYGAMYVTHSGEAGLPALASDQNLPPSARALGFAAIRTGLLVVSDRPLVSRTFLPDCGPAAIAVGFPGGQSYVYDAGQCRIRYAWKGGFVDNTDHWEGKGDAWAKVVGRIYYRASMEEGLRVASSNGKAVRPEVHWKGYRLIAGAPEFHYVIGKSAEASPVDGTDVRERVEPKQAGLQLDFSLEGALPDTVFFQTTPEDGATWTSSAGTWKDGQLALSSSEARHFALTLTETPKALPLGYWSMNDALWSSKHVDPRSGVVGRAFTPGGLSGSKHLLDSAIPASALASGATLMAWAKEDRAAVSGAVFSIGKDFAAIPAAAVGWHHYAWVFTGNGECRLFVDGSEAGPASLKVPDGETPVVIGSLGNDFFRGLLDEVRIYDRALPSSEIERVYSRERISATEAKP